MSHSTVLVVVRDARSAVDAEAQLDDLLTPFNENLDVEEYEVKVGDMEVGRATLFFRENPKHCDGVSGPAKPFDEFVTDGNLEAWVEWNRQAVGAYEGNHPDRGTFDATTDEYGYMSTWNQDGRWDWWTLGGRWHGFFQLKPGVSVGARHLPFDLPPVGGSGRGRGEKTIPGIKHETTAILGPGGTFGDSAEENFEGRADLARKGDIDFEAMRMLAAQTAEGLYDRFEEATKGLAVPPTWRDHLNACHLRHGPLGSALDNELRANVLNEARASFAEMPWNRALREAGLEEWFGESRERWCVDSGGRPTFVTRARTDATATAALLIDGNWIEQGLGWFEIANKKDGDEWAAQQARVLDSLPDDAYLAIVDIHS